MRRELLRGNLRREDNCEVDVSRLIEVIAIGFHPAQNISVLVVRKLFVHYSSLPGRVMSSRIASFGGLPW